MVHRVQVWSHSRWIGALVGSDGLCHLGPGDLRGQLGWTRSLWSGRSQADLTAGLRLTY